MKIFFDTEFMEDGETIKPLSLAFITSNGHGLYIIIDDAPREEANQFVVDNVLPYLDIEPPCKTVRCKRAEAGGIILHWVRGFTRTPEFWAWYGAYDWVLVCQLFGNMTDLPVGWPQFVRDLRQISSTFPTFRPDFDLPEHHAYYDTWLLKKRYEWETS
jgi:hypothetical protein